MKVIFDANVLLSYLLAPDPQQTVAWIVRTCFFSSRITVLAPTELVQETVEKVRSKWYFQTKISPETVEHFLSFLITHSDVPPAWQGQMARYGSDRKDDYLVAYGLLHSVDYLVTGDHQLLALQQIDLLRIVSPATMREVLVGYV